MRDMILKSKLYTYFERENSGMCLSEFVDLGNAMWTRAHDKYKIQIEVREVDKKLSVVLWHLR